MKIEKIKNVVVFLISILIVILTNINMESSDVFLDSFSCFKLNDVILTILYFLLFSRTIDIKDKRAKIIATILAIIFASCEILGYSMNKYCNLSCIIGSKTVFLKALLKFTGEFFVIQNIIILVYAKGLKEKKYINNIKSKFFTNNKKSFWLITSIIFLCYMPYFLCNYPGIISIDSVAEMSTALYNMDNMINHHPVFHIFIVSIFMNIGKALNNYNMGIALYSLCQMVFTSITFSYVLYYLAKKNVNFYIRLICFIFFAVYPPFACFSVTMWKDVPFGLAMVFYTITMIEIATTEDFFISKKNNLMLIISMIFVILFRNNGVYVVFLTMPFVILFAKKYRKNASIIFAIVIAFYLIWKGPVFSIFNVKDEPIKEALSVPVQQIARTVKYNEEKLSKDERDEINKYLPVNEIGNLYYPLISDNVKDTLNNKAVENNKVEFIKLWVKLFVKYPKEYIEAFLSGSFGYWYPEAKNWVICDFDDEAYELGRNALGINIEKKPIIELGIIGKCIHFINVDSATIISGFFSIGLAFFLIMFMLFYVVYKRKYRFILVYLPVMFLWLTSIASPVWCEYRYVYSMFTCMPLLSICALDLLDKERVNSK